MSEIDYENIWTVPNMLCMTRIILTPYIAYLILQEEFNMAFVALVVAGVTDFLDGWIARTFESQASRLGSFLDPLADKVLITTVFLSLTFAQKLPVFLTFLVVLRDVVLFSAGLMIKMNSLPSSGRFWKLRDLSSTSVQLCPTFISKVNTAVQLITVAITLAASSEDIAHQCQPVVYSLWCLTGATTVASGLSYLLVKNTFKSVKRVPSR